MCPHTPASRWPILAIALLLSAVDSVDARARHTRADEAVPCELSLAEVSAAIDGDDLLVVTTPQGPLSLRLKSDDVRAPAFRAEVTGAGGRRRGVAPGPLLLATGSVDGDPSSLVRIAVTEAGARGLVATGQDRYLLGQGAIDWYPAETVAHEAGAEALRVLTVATDADAEYVKAAGSPEAAASEILAAMYIVDGLFQSEFGVMVRIGYMHMWEGDDPFDDARAAGRIREFYLLWERDFRDVPRDVAHMFMGRVEGNLLGAAWTGVVCRQPVECYSVSLRWLSGSILAHELAHNLGAREARGEGTESCHGTLMSSPASNKLTFCSESREQVLTYLATHDHCLNRLARECTAPVAPEHWRAELYRSRDPLAPPDAVVDLGEELDVDLDSASDCLRGAQMARLSRIVRSGDATARLSVEGAGSATITVNGAIVFDGDLSGVPAEASLLTREGVSVLDCRLTRTGAGRVRLVMRSLAPAPPAAVTQRANRRRLALSWVDASSDEDGFVVERLDPYIGWVEVLRVAPDTTTVRLRHPAEPHATYGVRSFGPEGYSYRVVATLKRD